MGERPLGNSLLMDSVSLLSEPPRLYFSLKFCESKKLLKLNPTIWLFGFERYRMLMFLLTMIESSIDDRFFLKLISKLLEENFLSMELGGYVVVVVSDSVGYSQLAFDICLTRINQFK